MGRQYILFDVNYLAYRAHYSTGGLEHAGEATGVVYGVLKELQAARERFPHGRFVFCFDHASGLREIYYPGYKATRRNRRITEEEEIAIQSLRSQVTNLKFKYLEKLGYTNVFYQSGYEADDIIATFCHNLLKDRHTAVVYSDDKDLYQLLSPQVSMYKPRTGVLYTSKDFVAEYAIPPTKWAKVKAIAGCSSDDVVGVPGVGEATAVKYIKGELKEDSKKFRDIRSQKKTWLKNLPLVKLPLGGCRVPIVTKDAATPEKWDALVGTMGMQTLLNDRPAGIDRKKLIEDVYRPNTKLVKSHEG